MEQSIIDAVEELTPAENKPFIMEYLEWSDSLENCTLQLDRPLVRLFKGDAQVATLHLETAALDVYGVEGA